MDEQVELWHLYSAMGCIKLDENAGPWCGGCQYLIDLDGHYYFCDRKAIIEDVQDYLSALYGDMAEIRSCQMCKYAPHEYCDCNGDENSESFQRWRKCYANTQKQCWEWRGLQHVDGK